MNDEAVGQATTVETATDVAAATSDMAAATDVVRASGAGSGSMLRPLRLRDFRLLFTGETISLIGDQFHFIALAWLALELTGSGLVLGSVLLVAGLPRMVLMLVGGALADRISPRSVMLVSNGLRTGVVALLAVLVLSERVELLDALSVRPLLRRGGRVLLARAGHDRAHAGERGRPARRQWADPGQPAADRTDRSGHRRRLRGRGGHRLGVRPRRAPPSPSPPWPSYLIVGGRRPAATGGGAAGHAAARSAPALPTPGAIRPSARSCSSPPP